ncbi:MAG: hypothetical protein KDI79_27110 [Anaerolineae bacterium]|nr:hypothetical protein [Anaerolineae bacterium]
MERVSSFMNNVNLSRFGERGKSISPKPTANHRRWLWKTAVRYGLWLVLAATANANRRHFGLTTTWLPHLLGNSVALFLPEIYRLIDSGLQLAERLPADRYPTPAALRLSLNEVVADNPDYVDYVAPAALAYIVSHPHFNIYRGSWGEKNILGFGFDSIPHSTTAYALSTMIYDSIEAVDSHTPANAVISTPVKFAAKHKIAVVGTILAGLTLFYETSEFLIHKAELKARNNDVSQINMMWSLKDTIYDILSNTMGWAAATYFRGGRR